MQRPQTRYTALGELSIAYQVVGDGPALVWVPMFTSHLDLMWTEPGFERLMRRVSGFSRLILFDMPGTGLSDRVSRVLTLDERTRVIAAVLDAAGCDRAAVCGTSEGGQASMVFAATHPERASALILYSTYAKWPSRRELPQMLEAIGTEPAAPQVDDLAGRLEERDRELDEMARHWGEGRSIDLVAAPPHSFLERRFWAVFERAAMSPTTARAAIRALREFDVTDVLPAITAPTLVLHPSDDRVVPVESGRYLAASIPRAKLVETSGDHHGFMFGDVVMTAAEIERFLTGASRPWDPDRTFATILFTDIVASTERAAALGDRAWRELLQRHDALVQERVEAAGGRVVKQTGDGFLMAFDRPADAIRCADQIRAEALRIGIQLRAGLHSGECEVVRDDLAGLTVHIGARIAALAEPGEVLASAAVSKLVEHSGIALVDRGAHRLKGVPGEWRVFALQGGDRTSAGMELLGGPPADRSRRDRVATGLAERAPGLIRGTTRLMRARPRQRRRNRGH